VFALARARAVVGLLACHNLHYKLNNAVAVLGIYKKDSEKSFMSDSGACSSFASASSMGDLVKCEM